MGDKRYVQHYAQVKSAADPAQAIRDLSDEGVIAALGAASLDNDSYLANVLATEALNRLRRAKAATIARGTDGDGSGGRPAEDFLRAPAEWLRAVFDAVEEPMFVVLYPSRIITAMNAAAERTFGYSASAMVGRSTRLLHVDDEHHATLGKLVAAAFSRGEVAHVDFVMRRSDGSTLPVEISVSLLRDARDEPIGVVAVVHDVTARRRTEKELRELHAGLETRVSERTRALAHANAELEAFTDMASHDLRAPIRAIETIADYTVRDYADALGPEGRERLEAMRVSARRMSGLIDGLLHLSRSSRAEIIPERVDVSALAEDVGKTLAARSPGRRVAFVVEGGLFADADPQLLRVVIENLLGNAWKYTGKCADSRVEFGAASAPAGGVAFFVRDNGAGFEASRAGELFHAFRRLHGNEFEGSGIGLATVRRIVERHGGRAWAEGTPGRGATFWFTLGSPTLAPRA